MARDPQAVLQQITQGLLHPLVGVQRRPRHCADVCGHSPDHGLHGAHALARAVQQPLHLIGALQQADQGALAAGRALEGNPRDQADQCEGGKHRKDQFHALGIQGGRGDARV